MILQGLVLLLLGVEWRVATDLTQGIVVLILNYTLKLLTMFYK